MGAGEECASASVHPRRAVALSAFVFICAEVEAALKSETAGGGGWGEEAEEGRASPSPSVPSPLHASGPHPIPDSAPPPVTTFLWGLLINRPSISIMPPKLLFVALRGRNNQYVLWGQRAH